MWGGRGARALGGGPPPLRCPPTPQPGTLAVDDDALTTLVKQVKREARANPDATCATLLECAVQLSPKAPLFALLIGGWRACVRAAPS